MQQQNSDSVTAVQQSCTQLYAFNMIS